MNELLTEKEQIEAMRSWWRENGRYIISGVVLGIALLVGWNYWNKQQDQSALEASARYESLMERVADSDREGATPIAADLYENYPATAYAELAHFAMAKLYMDLGRDQDAAKELSALITEGEITQGESSETQLLARLRLAKILLYQDKPQEAVDLLQGYRDTAFAARYSDALGDAFAALGRFDDAAEAYTAALADNPNAPTVNRNLIQMKINDLPGPTVTAATENDTAADPSAAVTGEDSEQSPPAAIDDAAEDASQTDEETDE